MGDPHLSVLIRLGDLWCSAVVVLDGGVRGGSGIELLLDLRLTVIVESLNRGWSVVCTLDFRRLLVREYDPSMHAVVQKLSDSAEKSRDFEGL